MKNLLRKELRLALHPACPVFLLLSAMLLIPNYPYHVAFFYTALGIFFICLQGRENQDVFYTMLLPVGRRELVKGRFLMAVLLELCQFVLVIPCAILRQRMPLPPNQVGLDANITLFASCLLMLGLFHVVFFGIYYRDVRKVGRAFVLGSLGMFLYMALVEVLCHVLPFARDVLDTPDPAFLPQKLGALALGAVAYLLLTWAAYCRAVRNFSRQDL